MAVTPNYGWPVPVATDYVKDGWEAISDLGNAIDTTVAGLGSGLNLIKTQTIGSGVSTVTVSDAFSTTYNSYKIIISGGVGSYNGTGLKLQLGASTASYYYSQRGNFYTGADATENGSNVSIFGSAGTVTTDYLFMNCDLFDPYLTKYTRAQFTNIRTNYQTTGAGVHLVAASYTAFTLIPDIGTITGGTIYVYGYQKS